MFYKNKDKKMKFDSIDDRLKYDSNSFDYNKKRATKIGESSMNDEDKLHYLDHNKKFNYVLSDVILKYGINLLNIFQSVDSEDFGEPGVDEYGNTFIDFLDSDNNFAFNEIEKINNTYKAHCPRTINYITHNRYTLVLFIRDSLLDLYQDLSFAKDEDKLSEDCDLKKIKHRLYIFVGTVSYFLFDGKERKKYIDAQLKLIKDLFIEYLEDYDYKEERDKLIPLHLYD